MTARFGRVSSQLSQGLILQDLQRSQRLALSLQRQLSTQRRVNVASDDPNSATNILRLDNTLKQNVQFNRNNQFAQQYLGISETTLGEFTDIINSARTILLREGSDTATEQTRHLSAGEISSLLQRALQFANTKLGERFIFAGSDTAATPFELVNGAVRYNGNEEALTTLIGPLQALAFNIAGSDAFSALTNMVRGDRDLNPNITFGGRVGTATGGTAATIVDASLIGRGERLFVGLDVVMRTGANAGEVRRVTGFNSATGTITLAGPALPAAVAAGDTYDIKGASTAIADLHHGNGVDAGSFMITDGLAGSATIAMDGIHTIADLVNAINGQTNLSVMASLNAAGNGLELTATAGGVNIAVSEVDGGRVASQLGILTAAGGAGVGVPVVGSDLDPLLTKDTSLGLLNAGAGFDQASGLEIHNGDEEAVIDFSQGVYTIQDLFNRIEAGKIHTLGRINESGTGIDLVSRLNGAFFSIDENAGTTADDLGLLVTPGEIPISQINRGLGLATVAGSDDVQFTLGDGTVFTVSFDGVNTLQDVIDRINTAAGADLTASLDKDDLVFAFSGSATRLDMDFSGTNFGGFINSMITASNNAGILVGQGIAGDDFNFQIQDAMGVVNVDFRNTGVTSLAQLYDAVKDAFADGDLQAVPVAPPASGNYSIITDSGLTMDITLPVGLTPDAFWNNWLNNLSLAGEATLTPAAEDLTVQFTADGTSVFFDVSGALNFGDLWGQISAEAALNGADNGTSTRDFVEIIATDNTGGPNPLAIANINGSFAGDQLGLTTVGGSFSFANNIVSSADLEVSGTQSDSLFTALLRLQQALDSNDRSAILDTLDVFERAERAVLDSRTVVGTRLQAAENTVNRTEDTNVNIEQVLGSERDIDFAEVVLKFQQQQTALQAGLSSAGAIFNLSLLDFI